MGATRALAALLFVVGCGDVEGKKPDAAVPRDAPPDMMIDSAPRLWQTPVPMASVNTASDDRTPWLSADGLTLYFSSNRAGGQGSYDSWRATRTSASAPFGTAENVPAINSAAAEESPYVAASGARIWFSRIVAGQMMEIMVATGSGGNWGTPAQVTEVNSTANDGTPMVTDNGEAMYLFSRRGANGDADLYVAQYNSSASTWMTPSTTTLAMVNSPSQEIYPHLSSDGLRLYLISNRGGAYAVHIATRTSATGDFGAPSPISELASLVADGGLWISDDENHMIVSANNDLYETRR